MVWKKDAHVYTWNDLEGKIIPEVLCAPRTGGDSTGEWVGVHARVIGYLVRNVVDKPWADHLTLISSVFTAQRRDVATVINAMRTLHPRFALLFPLFELTSVSQWSVERHLVPYMRGEVLPQDPLSLRVSFLKCYMSATNLVANWLDSLPPREQEMYRPFLFPVVNAFVAETLRKLKEEVVQQQQGHRKEETEAVVPQFTALRAEAHFRYNRMMRLWQAYQHALTQVHADHSNLPLEFSYEEGDPPVERIVCRLWDRRSFVLHPEHSHHYGKVTVKDARAKRGSFKDDHNEVFLEVVKVERLEGEAPPEGFWFLDILQRGLLSERACQGSEQEVAEKQAWLRQWGYGDDNTEVNTHPFETTHPGLLKWSYFGDGSYGRGQFVAYAQLRMKGTLVPVESLYAATTFGLLALELLTTTGMRINELMQVSLSPESLIRMVDDPPPGASDQSPRIRYVLRLLPKGERTEKRHHYGIGKDALRLIEQTAHMLCAHYQLQAGEPLPRVQFYPHHARSHRFGEEKIPYIFQYHAQHLRDTAISACLRFLMHGMTFQTSEGLPVILKPHLLRHAFATFAVQIEGLPIDLVAEWLKQKNLDTTRYYSQKGQQEIAEEHASFVERLATEINIREAIVRSPEEIRKLAESARRRVGTLVPVCGGECTFDGWCHNQYDCIRCPSKAPEPEKRYQVEEKQRWAEERLAYYEREGLVLEAEKMRQLLRNCALELREMDLMVAYRKDEGRVAQVKFYPRNPKG
ncbi:MAG TPA: hypothetical protein VNE61_00885 [Ktedonobacteraceae bacterium]|nr:hypothetical protein [Ktedonobacteraceae bacterium]